MMKAISIRQPWAFAILHWGKNVENRTWSTRFRGTVLIHTGKGFDRASYEWMKEQSKGMIPRIEEFQRGGIVGQVDIIDCVESMDSPWFSGPWGWVLENPKPLPFLRIGLTASLPGLKITSARGASSSFLTANGVSASTVRR